VQNKLCDSVLDIAEKLQAESESPQTKDPHDTAKSASSTTPDHWRYHHGRLTQRLSSIMNGSSSILSNFANGVPWLAGPLRAHDTQILMGLASMPKLATMATVNRAVQDAFDDAAKHGPGTDGDTSDTSTNKETLRKSIAEAARLAALEGLCRLHHHLQSWASSTRTNVPGMTKEDVLPLPQSAREYDWKEHRNRRHTAATTAATAWLAIQSAPKAVTTDAEQ
jgi:hypothetical protein